MPKPVSGIEVQFDITGPSLVVESNERIEEIRTGIAVQATPIEQYQALTSSGNEILWIEQQVLPTVLEEVFREGVIQAQFSNKALISDASDCAASRISSFE